MYEVERTLENTMKDAEDEQMQRQTEFLNRNSQHKAVSPPKFNAIPIPVGLKKNKTKN